MVKSLRESLQGKGLLVAVDRDNTAPALYLADKSYTVPRSDHESYLSVLLEICEKEAIKVVLPLVNKDIPILAANQDKFSEKGIVLLVSSLETVELCLDRYMTYKILKDNNIHTTKTYFAKAEIMIALEKKDLGFPLFAKLRKGDNISAATIVVSTEDLDRVLSLSDDYIIQEYMHNCIEVDADIYVDKVSKKVVSIFSKLYVENRHRGTTKTVSFHDDRLFDMIHEVNRLFDFAGPIDMRFFCDKGVYYLTKINPHFGGAYPHAYGTGVDFIPLILNNIGSTENMSNIGNYEKNVVMMMYDEVVIHKQNELIWGKYS